MAWFGEGSLEGTPAAATVSQDAGAGDGSKVSWAVAGSGGAGAAAQHLGSGQADYKPVIGRSTSSCCRVHIGTSWACSSSSMQQQQLAVPTAQRHGASAPSTQQNMGAPAQAALRQIQQEGARPVGCCAVGMCSLVRTQLCLYQRLPHAGPPQSTSLQLLAAGAACSGACVGSRAAGMGVPVCT